MSLAKATFHVEMRQTCDHLVEASIKTIYKVTERSTWWMDRSTYAPCILSKETGDSNVTLLKYGMTINLPCEQAPHGYSLGKRIF